MGTWKHAIAYIREGGGGGGGGLAVEEVGIEMVGTSEEGVQVQPALMKSYWIRNCKTKKK